MRDMKETLRLFNLNPYLMAQPNGYRCPDGGTFGWCQLPEFPFAVEPRQITRWEARKWAREAYNIGVRLIGGCCGFEPYHIRAMAEELLDCGANCQWPLPSLTTTSPFTRNWRR